MIKRSNFKRSKLAFYEVEAMYKIVEEIESQKDFKNSFDLMIILVTTKFYKRSKV